MRKSGVLLHISSLPSPYGIGTLGQAAYDFVDFLQAGGQHCWQILPTGPTSYGDSPYSPLSCFAGNEYFIDLDMLCADGLLEKDALDSIPWEQEAEQVDYATMFEYRIMVLQSAYEHASAEQLAEMDAFCKENAFWLEGYALYRALKAHFSYAPWYEWEQDIRVCAPKAVAAYSAQLQDEIRFISYVQYLFHRQWFALKEYANTKQVEIIGDIPIYAAYDSAEVWFHGGLFQLDKNKKPSQVAGCPPDYFSETGQLWGNPVYRWNVMAKDNYSWWVSRIAHCAKLYNKVRIDHFRGFESYYSIPAKDETAENGKWKKGPGLKLFTAIREKLGEVDIIAEDLGVMTPAVEKLLAATGYPGMRILQFAFDDQNLKNPYLPHNYCTNTVVYTGTHDNDTLVGWCKKIPQDVRTFAEEYLMLPEEEDLAEALILNAQISNADLCVIPLQDYLHLDSSARLNTPSTATENWQWRLTAEQLTPALAEQLAILCAISHR